MPRLVKQISRHNRSHIGFNDRPFDGSGVSLYVTMSDAVRYRNIRIIDGNWIKGIDTEFDIAATSVLKTARITSGSSPLTSLSTSLADGDYVVDIRAYRDDVENESSNSRTIPVTITGGADVSDILGTATLLAREQRDGGIVRLRFLWEPAANGVQPDTFTAIRTAGPTSPANSATTVDPGVRLLIAIDTPALSDASAYTYKIQASLSAVTKDVLTGINVEADATGPDAPDSATAEAW